ncbi:MAG: FdtA/QdtA family cupin domain-containing protein [Lachnospiraceae bacterium]|nr:FdtA/QdtA family cupin domain-containing protein [Lachnospiraceae bacterium]MBR3761702.1 FdtA/QdtA family cupin domain-containing protein [Lachnospiraceae bacterium]
MKLADQIKILEFIERGDERGNLVVIEGEEQDIPFDIKRVFYIYGSDATVVRGQHANRRTKFVLINVAGESKVKVDNGFETQIISLDKPRMGLFLDTMVWKDMYDFSPDSILLVLCSEHYDGSEYIRDYDSYIKEVRKGHCNE